MSGSTPAPPGHAHCSGGESHRPISCSRNERGFDLHRRPNAFGLRMSWNTYDLELCEGGQFRGGDGGGAVHGGFGKVLSWMPLASAFHIIPEDEDIDGWCIEDVWVRESIPSTERGSQRCPSDSSPAISSTTSMGLGRSPTAATAGAPWGQASPGPFGQVTPRCTMYTVSFGRRWRNYFGPVAPPERLQRDSFGGALKEE